MNTDLIHQLAMESLTKKLAQTEGQAAQNEALYLVVASELQLMKDVLEYDSDLKDLFEEVKTTRLVGNLKIGDEVVKQYTVDVDEHGVSTVSEFLYHSELYAEHRLEMRNQEKLFRDKRYELEDAVLAEIESNKKEQ